MANSCIHIQYLFLIDSYVYEWWDSISVVWYIGWNDYDKWQLQWYAQTETSLFERIWINKYLVQHGDCLCCGYVVCMHVIGWFICQMKGERILCFVDEYSQRCLSYCGVVVLFNCLVCICMDRLWRATPSISVSCEIISYDALSCIECNINAWHVHRWLSNFCMIMQASSVNITCYMITSVACCLSFVVSWSCYVNIMFASW
jgi:hypothetical protein